MAGLVALAAFTTILPGVSAERFIVVGPLLLLVLGLLVVLRRAYVCLASLALGFSFWAAVTVACVIAGGVHAPALSAYRIVVLISGLALGWQAALGFAAVSLISEIVRFFARRAKKRTTKRRKNTAASFTSCGASRKSSK
ncbi:MAG TPA: hypothetical protein VKE41_16810 [Roseiflexaceae bacterium]|nr:hypothetical protein [Roseiflexaceae bacterium]